MIDKNYWCNNAPVMHLKTTKSSGDENGATFKIEGGSNLNIDKASLWDTKIGHKEPFNIVTACYNIFDPGVYVAYS